MWHNVHTVCIFMHTGIQRKNVSKGVWLPGARVVEKVIPLLDCTRASRGRMSAKASGCPARE